MTKKIDIAPVQQETTFDAPIISSVSKWKIFVLMVALVTFLCSVISITIVTVTNCLVNNSLSITFNILTGIIGALSFTFFIWFFIRKLELIKIKNEELNDKIYKLFTLLSSLFIVVLSSINLVLVNNDAFNGKTFDTSDWGVLVCDIMLGIIFFVNLIFLIKFIIKKIMKKDSKTK
ncbi:MAG: hypothetical protein LBV48_00900 [Mycoplasmataceae bacterium]|nr:hypothetical protein [Mycoplasmataceae bacterium]